MGRSNAAARDIPGRGSSTARDVIMAPLRDPRITTYEIHADSARNRLGTRTFGDLADLERAISLREAEGLRRDEVIAKDVDGVVLHTCPLADVFAAVRVVPAFEAL